MKKDQSIATYKVMMPIHDVIIKNSFNEVGLSATLYDVYNTMYHFFDICNSDFQNLVTKNTFSGDFEYSVKKLLQSSFLANLNKAGQSRKYLLIHPTYTMCVARFCREDERSYIFNLQLPNTSVLVNYSILKTTFKPYLAQEFIKNTAYVLKYKLLECKQNIYTEGGFFSLTLELIEKPIQLAFYGLILDCNGLNNDQ
jgi:hypothetical protein